MRALRAADGRAWVLTAATLAFAAGLVLGSGILALLALVLAGTAAARRLLPWDAALPAAVAVLLLFAVAAAQLSYLAGLDMTGSSVQALVVVGLVVGAGALLMRGTPASGLRPLPRGPWTAVAFLPAVAMLAVGLVNAFSEQIAFNWIAAVPDPAAHAGFVADMRVRGGLDYSLNPYPQALHALAAWSETAVGQPLGLANKLTSTAALSWLSYALLVAVAVSLAIRIYANRGPRISAVAGLATGLVLLGMNGFVSQFPLLGAHSSLLAITVLLLPLLLADARGPSGRREILVVLPLLASLVANLWTPVIIAGAVLGLGWTALVAVDTPRAQWLGLGLRMLPAAAVAAILLAPLLVSTGRAGGIGLAAIPGGAWFPEPAVMLAVPVAACGLLLAPRGRTQLLGGFLIAGCAAMLVVVALGTGDPLRLRQWYPTKALWVLIVVSTPFAVVATVRLASAYFGLAGRLSAGLSVSTGMARAVLAALAITALAVLGSTPFWQYLQTTPTALLPFKSGTRSAIASQHRIAVAERYAARFTPKRALPVEIEWAPGRAPLYPNITGRLVQLITGQPPGFGSRFKLCDQVRSVDDGHDVVIVSPVPTADLRRAAQRGGCGSVEIVRIARIGKDR